jgi:hypothetical protein
MQDELTGTGPAFPFDALADVNLRGLDLLTAAARNDRRPALPLVERLRPLFRHSTPELRRRVAQRGFLLLDFEFQNVSWWRGIRKDPGKRWRTSGLHEAFPRAAAIALARSTITLAWHSLKADFEGSCMLLGITHGVAEVIATLAIPEIDGIAGRRHRHLIPRWPDRPALWNELFLTSQTGTPNAVRNVNLHALSLIAGALLPRPGHERP